MKVILGQKVPMTLEGAGDVNNAATFGDYIPPFRTYVLGFFYQVTTALTGAGATLTWSETTTGAVLATTLLGAQAIGSWSYVPITASFDATTAHNFRVAGDGAGTSTGNIQAFIVVETDLTDITTTGLGNLQGRFGH